MNNQLFSNLKEETAYQFRSAGNKLFPEYIKRPFPKEHLAEILAIDPIENAETTPPEDEFIDLYSVWAVEFYTPAYFDDLLESLERLEWNKEVVSQGPVDWLKRQRIYQYGQSWMPLHIIIPRDALNSYPMERLRADLPQGVLYANGDVHCITPSLIAIVMEFVLCKEVSHSLDKALRQDRISYVTHLEKGFRIHNPENQKKNHIAKIRKESSDIVSGWISNNIPGLFSTGLLNGAFPTCEFLSLRKGMPFPTKHEKDEGFVKYLWLLGLDNSYDAWKSIHLQGLRFNPSLNIRARMLQYHGVLAINESTWIQQDNDSATKTSRINRLHYGISGFLVVRAIPTLLEGYARHFQELRNSDLFGHIQRMDAEETLRSVSESVSYSADIAAVTSELSSYVKRGMPLGFNAENFTSCTTISGDAQDLHLLGVIQRQIGEKSAWLQITDKAIRDHLTQHGTLIGMMEDVRLQKRISRLTFAILFLTVVLAILTIITVSNSPLISYIVEFLR